MGSYLSTALPENRQKATYTYITEAHQKKNGKNDGPNKAHPNEHITAQNSIQSRFHSLPTELLLEIDSYLGSQPSASCYSAAVPRMAFRATCRRFRAELSGPPGPKHCWSSWDRRAYSGVLKLAKFRALCVKEKEGKLGTAEDGGGGLRRVCSICQSSHSDECFTPVEQKKEPEKRMCIGSQGVLQICPHNRVTYAGLRIKPINITCNGDHWDGSNKCSGIGSTVKVREVDEQGKQEAKVEIVLSLGAVELQTQKRGVVKALKDADWSVCPHLRTGDQDAWHTMLLNDSDILSTAPSNTLLGILSHRIFQREKPRWHIHTCAAPNCDTRITLFTTPKSGITTHVFLFIKIERYLGELKGGADGQKWLAQIVEASQLEEDRLGTAAVHGTHEMARRMNISAGLHAESGWWVNVSRRVRSWFVDESKDGYVTVRIRNPQDES